jgi:hypothetical protein
MPNYKTSVVRERRIFPSGSVIVLLAQPSARVAMNLLEPSAPDSLAAWGFFNAVFEQKEFGENYVLEKLAREMMQKDENLRRNLKSAWQAIRSLPQAHANACNFSMTARRITIRN